ADHLVVTAARLQVGGDVVAVQGAHRMPLQAPAGVVPADYDHGQPVPDQRVRVHQREAGRAVAEQQDDLHGRMGDPGRDGVAQAGTQAAERAGIKPSAGPERLDVFTRERDEVAAVPDDHGVVVQDLEQLAVDP